MRLALILAMAIAFGLSATGTSELFAQIHSAPKLQRAEASSAVSDAATALPKRSRAAETPLPPNGGETRRSPAASSPWTTFGLLAVMIVAVLAIARLWKKHGPLSTTALPPEAVELLGRKMIDQRNTIQLVRIGSRIVVIGVSPQGLSTLAEIEDPIEVDLLAGLCQKRGGETKSQSFRTLFNKQPQRTFDAPSTGNVVGGVPLGNRAERAPRSPSRPAPNLAEYLGGSHE
jgi:flagellar biogenesis protein FliO